MSTLTASRSTTTIGAALPLGGVAALLGIAGIFYGAHDWLEIGVLVAVVVVVTALVFGVVVPRALRKESAGGIALALSIPAVLITLPAFWSGLPIVLGAAGVLVGNAGRNAHEGSGKCITAVVLGVLAVVGHVLIYVLDALMGTGGGFLMD